MFAARNMTFASSGIDPDAALYLNAVSAAGADITGAQRLAVSNWFVSGKTNGWLPLIKRLYLPIWGNAIANAIDLPSLTSGSFVGTVNHNAGYVNNDGATGYFLLDKSPSALGLTTSSGSIYCLITAINAVNGSTTICGVQDTDNNTRTWMSSGGQNFRAMRVFLAAGVGYPETDSRSVLIASRTSTTTLSAFKRTSSGFTTTINEAAATSPVLGTVNPMAFMATSNNGTPQFFSPATLRFGAYGMGMSMNSVQAESFSGALKTMWETCTGLTLP